MYLWRRQGMGLCGKRYRPSDDDRTYMEKFLFQSVQYKFENRSRARVDKNYYIITIIIF